MKLTSYLSLLLITTTLVCFSVFAQQKNRWVFITRNSDGTLFYIDKSSRQVSGDTIRVWDKNIFLNGSFRISLVEWKCSEKKYLFVEASDYSATGKFILKNTGTEWINVIPDSISEALYKAVCITSSEKSSEIVSSNKKMAEIIVRKANVRTEPNINSSIVQQASLGKRFSLADDQSTNGWYQIILAGTNKTAWIYGNNIKFVEIANKSNTKKQKVKRQN
ncbi:MAG: SH3 domain-containing protein [Pyrinomonadaceae bacterium]